MSRVAVFITTYNRPNLVRDAIESVFEQTFSDWTLYLLDDGSSPEARRRIEECLASLNAVVEVVPDDPSGRIRAESEAKVVWWQGKDRSIQDRRATISYSGTINLGVNFLLGKEEYICYLVDDDYFYPESIEVRVRYLDEHPDCHVVYGRLRAVQFGISSFNQWTDVARPVAGRAYPRPCGTRVLSTDGTSAITYFGEVPEVVGDLRYQRYVSVSFPERDPETGLPYVEEGFFLEGPCSYNVEGCTDHNQVMHRIECFKTCREWPGKSVRGGTLFWPEDRALHQVGDFPFFTLLGEVHPFVGIKEWICTKKYHALSDGVALGPVRE